MRRSKKKASTPTIPAHLPNAFDPGFLERVVERDQPSIAAEAEAVGPWLIEEIPGVGFGLFRLGEGHARGFRPYAVFYDRSLALLAAAVLPGTCREAALRLGVDAEHGGYPVRDAAGEVAGYLALYDEALITALHTGGCLLRSPESLANLLEAGGMALERAGAILDQRFPERARTWRSEVASDPRTAKG